MKTYLIKNTKAVAYCRLSIEDGDKIQSNSIDSQIKIIEQYCLENKLDLIDIYVDDGYSGGNFNRPAFKLMINDLEEKKFNCIITKDLSRLGRNYVEVGKYLDGIFLENCIRYISIGDNYDSSKNDDDSIVINNICNTLYLKDCRRKANQVFERKANIEDMFVRKYGYKYNDQKQVAIDEEAYYNLRLIMESYLKYKSLNKVVQILKDNKVLTRKEYHLKNKGLLNNPTYNWDTAMISNILKDYEYCGHAINMPKRKDSRGNYYLNQDVVIMKNVRPVIFTEEEHIKAKQIGKSNLNFSKNDDIPHLKRKVYLKDNDKTMTYCKSLNKNKPAKYKNKETGKYVLAEDLHTLLYLDIKNMFQQAFKGKDKLYQFLENKYNKSFNKKTLDELNKEQKRVESLFQKYFEDKIEGKLSKEEYESKIEKLIAVSNYIEMQKEKLKLKSISEIRLKNKAKCLYNKIMNNKLTNKIDLINEFVSKVIIDVISKTRYSLEIIY